MEEKNKENEGGGKSYRVELWQMILNKPKYMIDNKLLSAIYHKLQSKIWVELPTIIEELRLFFCLIEQNGILN
ncbi:MAG: hypothetical protein ABIK78_05360 [candidate division WOR-3 bacterium]